jgi:hypothetical protein
MQNELFLVLWCWTGVIAGVIAGRGLQGHGYIAQGVFSTFFDLFKLKIPVVVTVVVQSTKKGVC